MPDASYAITPDDTPETALAKIRMRESGGQNVDNTQGGASWGSGLYQIVPSTWREGLGLAGIQGSWATAKQAPDDVQHDVALALYNKYGEKPWLQSAPGLKGVKAQMADPTTATPTVDTSSAPAPLDTGTLAQILQLMQPPQTKQASGPAQSFVSLLGSALGGGGTGAANLSPAEKEAAGIRALSSFGGGLLANSGWHRTPVTLGEALGSGIGQAQQSMLGSDELSMGLAAAAQQQRTENISKALTFLTGATTAGIQKGELTVRQRKEALEERLAAQEAERVRLLTGGAPAPTAPAAAPPAAPQTPLPLPPTPPGAAAAQPPTGGSASLPVPPIPPASPPPTTGDPNITPPRPAFPVEGTAQPMPGSPVQAIVAGMQQTGRPPGTQFAGPGVPTGLATADDPDLALAQAKQSGQPVLVKGGNGLAALPNGGFAVNPPTATEPTPAAKPPQMPPGVPPGGVPARFEDYYRKPDLPDYIKQQVADADKLTPAQEAQFTEAQRRAALAGKSTDIVTAMNEVNKARAAAIAQNQQKAQDAVNTFYKENMQLQSESHRTQLQAQEARATDAQRQETEATMKQRDALNTESLAAASRIDDLDGLKVLSDNVGDKNTNLASVNVGGSSLLNRFAAAGLGTKEQLASYGNMQAFQVGVSAAIKSLRQGMSMGNMSNMDLQFVENMAPSLMQDQRTRSEVIAYLKAMQYRKIQFGAEVERLMTDGSGTKIGGAIKAARESLPDVVPTIPADMATRPVVDQQAWFKANVRPHQLVRVLDPQHPDQPGTLSLSTWGG